MSSLRIESLRLVWLETFLEVAEAENISAAARNMDVAQSTVSRHMQALEKWLGKTLIEPGKVEDPADAGTNVGLTEDGLIFQEIAEHIVKTLSASRTDEAKRNELLDGMEVRIAKMMSDLESRNPSKSAQEFRDIIENYAKAFEALQSGAPLKTIKSISQLQRKRFAEYECRLNRENRRTRGKSKPLRVIRVD